MLLSSTPRQRPGHGASFGLALEALGHEAAQPALGLFAQPDVLTSRERGSEITSYVVYGVTAERYAGWCAAGSNRDSSPWHTRLQPGEDLFRE